MSGQVYTLDFGFNWFAPEIGSSFGQPAGYFPVQYALVDASGNPAWPTQLSAQDSLTFQLTDISSVQGETPTQVADTVSESHGVYSPLRTVTEVAVAFGNASSTGGTWPFDGQPPQFDPSLGTSTMPGLVFPESDVVFQQDVTSAVYNAQNPNWKVARWFLGSALVVTFNGLSTFSRMSVSLSATYQRISKTFIFDPELFVGETEF